MDRNNLLSQNGRINLTSDDLIELMTENLVEDPTSLKIKASEDSIAEATKESSSYLNSTEEVAPTESTINTVLKSLVDSGSLSTLVLSDEDNRSFISNLVRSSVEEYLDKKKEALSKGYALNEEGIGNQRLRFRYTTTFEYNRVPIITLRTSVANSLRLKVLNDLADEYSTDDPDHKKILTKRLKAGKMTPESVSYIKNLPDETESARL